RPPSTACRRSLRPQAPPARRSGVWRFRPRQLATRLQEPQPLPMPLLLPSGAGKRDSTGSIGTFTFNFPARHRRAFHTLVRRPAIRRTGSLDAPFCSCTSPSQVDFSPAASLRLTEAGLHLPALG